MAGIPRQNSKQSLVLVTKSQKPKAISDQNLQKKLCNLHALAEKKKKKKKREIRDGNFQFYPLICSPIPNNSQFILLVSVPQGMQLHSSSFYSHLLRFGRRLRSPPPPQASEPSLHLVSLMGTYGPPLIRQTSELPDTTWDTLGFNKPMSTDYMFLMKSSEDGDFLDGGLQRFEKIEFNPVACVLNYGQGIIEELKAYKKHDGSILLFHLEEHGLRMRTGAERLCMPAPTVEQFVEGVKATVLANRRWVPPRSKGFLHIRPLLIGNGPVLSLTPAPEFTFLIYVSPMGNYFEGGLQPINLVVENEIHCAVRGGAGSVKAIGNYGATLKAQVDAKANGFSDVLYLDSVHNGHIEETSTANIFLVKDNVISTPALHEGTILPGITRNSVIEIARIEGYQVEERLVSFEELFEADEVFCTGNAVLTPVRSITYLDRRVSYLETGPGGVVSQKLHRALSNIQMGLTEFGGTVTLK